MLSRGFFYRRVSRIFTCYLRFFDGSGIALESKHVIASLQDVFLNPFYWEAVIKLPFVPTKIVDIGANYGLFSSLINNYLNYKNAGEREFLLIEANAKLVKYLNDNCDNQLNGSKFSVFDGVAGPKHQSKFKVNERNHLASRADDSGSVKNFIDFDLQIFQNTDLAKIDIEGAEKLLLSNYSAWLSGLKGIIIEFHYAGQELEDLYAVMKSLDFRCILSKSENSGFINELWIKK